MKPTTEFCEDVCDGVVAYYPFFGNANDTSGNGLDGVSSGLTMGVDRDGNPNRSYYFDGDPDGNWDYLSVGNVERIGLEEGSFSIVTIVKLDDINENWRLDEEDNPWFSQTNLVIGIDRNVGWMFLISVQYFPEDLRHRFLFQVGNYPTNHVDLDWRENNPIQYNHIVGVASRAENTLTFYMNGERVDESPWDGVIGGRADEWLIGGEGKKRIDEVRIYNRALSQAEIQQMIGN